MYKLSRSFFIIHTWPCKDNIKNNINVSKFSRMHIIITKFSRVNKIYNCLQVSKR